MSDLSPEGLPSSQHPMYLDDLPSSGIEVSLVFRQIDEVRERIVTSAGLFIKRPFNGNSDRLDDSCGKWVETISNCVHCLNGLGFEESPQIMARRYFEEDIFRVTALNSLAGSTLLKPAKETLAEVEADFSPFGDDEVLDSYSTHSTFSEALEEHIDTFQEHVLSTRKARFARVMPVVGNAALHVATTAAGIYIANSFRRKSS